MNPKFAIVRTPGETINRGLKIYDRGEVDVDLARNQHEKFCKTLETIGYRIVVWMDPNDDLPDSVFVEDPAVILGKKLDTLVMTRLAREERRGEEEDLEQILQTYFSNINRIIEPGLIEGGDVLVTDNMLYIGLSSRTNIEGAEQLARIAKSLGYDTKMIALPNDRLHLKGEVTYHPDTDTITVTPRLAPEFRDSKHRVIKIPVDDGLGRFGANCISKGKMMITTDECPEAERILTANGYSVLPVDLSEFNIIDGAMSCLDKFF